MQPEDRVDPMSRIFPRMTKCIFHKYGGSGTIQRFDALCVLSMNIVNEKIYIFLWFWYIILAIITGIGLLVRIGYFFLPNFRTRYVWYKQNIVKWRQYIFWLRTNLSTSHTKVMWYDTMWHEKVISVLDTYVDTSMYKYNYFQSYWIRKYGTSRQRSWSQTYSKHGGKISLFWLVDFVLLSSGKAISNTET